MRQGATIDGGRELGQQVVSQHYPGQVGQSGEVRDTRDLRRQDEEVNCPHYSIYTYVQVRTVYTYIHMYMYTTLV